MEDGGKPKKLCVQINYKLLLLTEEIIISLVTLYDNYNDHMNVTGRNLQLFWGFITPAEDYVNIRELSDKAVKFKVFKFRQRIGSKTVLEIVGQPWSYHHFIYVYVSMSYHHIVIVMGKEAGWAG